MISVFLGTDTMKSRIAAGNAFQRAQNEDTQALVTRFDDLSFDLALATERLNAESLFGGGNILYVEGILDHPDGETFYRTVLKETPHTVIIREMAPSKDLCAFFERIATVQVFEPVKKFEKRVDSFALADAMGARDKKRSWVEFEKVRRSGAVMEEVHGTVFWSWKSMYLCLMLPKEEVIKTGMKDFTYRNYSRFAQNYSTKELEDRLRELKEMYHRAHRGEGDFEVLLERFILNI